jgi:hypothetical protein
MEKVLLFLVLSVSLFLFISCKREKKELGPTVITVDTICNTLRCELTNPIVTFEVKGQTSLTSTDSTARISHLHGFIECEQLWDISFSSVRVSGDLIVGYGDSFFQRTNSETGRTEILFEDWSISFEGVVYPSEDKVRYQHTERLRFDPEEIIRFECPGGVCPLPGKNKKSKQKK